MSITVQNLNDPLECILDAESLGQHRTLGLVMDPFDVAAELPARRGAPAANARLMRVKNLALDSARGWVTVLLSGSASYVNAMLAPR
jgi:hypothetical protein